MKQPAVTSSIILYKGECAYVLKTGETYEVWVFSTNEVVHERTGITKNADQAESTCRRLNAYPKQVRGALGLR
jgi:hypothetical protein